LSPATEQALVVILIITLNLPVVFTFYETIKFYNARRAEQRAAQSTSDIDIRHVIAY
jgi:hypothetical protein